MHAKYKSISIITFIALITILAYWWAYYTPRYDLQMNVIGFQGEVMVNGDRLNKGAPSFNANQATITVPMGSIFNGKLEDGSYIQITEGSKVIIDKAKRNKESYRIRTKFVLDTGQVIRDIPKVENISDYSSSLISDSVNIGIRGTRYAAIADDRSTRTMLYRGSVVLDSKGLGEIVLKQNYGTVTEKGYPSQPPSELPPPPGLQLPVSAARIIDRQLSLQWQKVNNATSYQVQIADDPNFRNLVYQRAVSDTSYQISQLPYDEHYYWRVASIDTRGLRGDGSQSGNFHYKYHHENIKLLDETSAYDAALVEKALQGYGDDPQLFKDIGQYLYHVKRYQQAIDYYSKAIAINQTDDELLLARGRALQALGRHEEAQSDFNNTLSIKTDSPEAYWSLGMVEVAEGRLEKSIEYFFRAISSKPDHAEAHLSAASAWIKLGEPEKARRHLLLHLENFPDDITAQQSLEDLR